MKPTLKLALWNVEWAPPGRGRGAEIASRIERHKPDVVCLTEGSRNSLGEGWHAIGGGQDPDYPSTADRRKVLLFSRQPWEQVDAVGDASMPPGRFLCTRTATPLGPVWFVAVCIPWSHAHVATGRRDSAVWQAHLDYLDGLDSFLARRRFDEPVVLLGDFNQRIPRKRCPEPVFDRLMQVVGARFSLITADVIESAGEQAIDHVALGTGLAGRVVASLPRHTPDGRKLSDHFGLVLDLHADR